MALRSGFYYKDGIHRVDVDLPWKLGFDAYAKRQYIVDLHKLLGDKIPGCIADVTTASFGEFRALSPVLRKIGTDSVDAVFGMMKDVYCTDQDHVLAETLYDLLYFKSFDDAARSTIDKIDCFTDVFYNPSKYGAGTQALSLVRYKMLLAEGKLYLIEDAEQYYNWLREERISVHV